VFHDPEAAAIVLDAAADLGVPVTMYGLDVFYDVRVPRRAAARLAASDDPAARIAGRLVVFQCDRFSAAEATIGDAGTLCASSTPPVRVELTGSWTRGQTVVDRRTWTVDHDHDPHGIAPTVVDVALGIDGPRYARLWLEAVSGRLSGRV
jgi:inosine-uridine nucleoside N-ribohydrolase